MTDNNSFPEWYSGNNARIFKMMSIYLNLAPAYITPEMMNEITGGGKDGAEYAFAALAASACGLDIYDNPHDRTFFRNYFLPMIHRLEIREFKNDPFYTHIRFPDGKQGKWSFENRECKSYEAFVFDDPLILDDGRVIPQIGFFDEPYAYPAVLENGREWMTLMPNETRTSACAVSRAHGKVLTFGLGLGYFAYMAASKENVREVTVVERSADIISLFRESILPQFECRDKIRVIESDAFEYADRYMENENFDFIFTDLWHDPSDGTELYLRMKKYENRLPKAEFVYWIEKTLKLYI